MAALASIVGCVTPVRAQARASDARWGEALVQDGVAVVINRRAMPRAWLVSEVQSVTPEEALKAIRGETHDELDPAKTALLEVPGKELPVVAASRAPSDGATVETSDDGFAVVTTTAHAPAFLVLSESYFPGWRATVDGAQASVFVTDYLLIGVPVPAGSHRVVLRYTAPGARYGAIISALTLAGLVGLGVYGWRRGRAAPSG